MHLWTQIVGKVRVAQTPWVNHQWHVVLYLTARGLTTSPIAYQNRIFEIEFDFIRHRLAIHTDQGRSAEIPLTSGAVADFYDAVLGALNGLDIHVRIHSSPNEIPAAVPFPQDRAHRSYVPEHAQRFWRALLQVDRVFKHFRSGFIGKASPVHFFWGSFDLAVTRFSGRPAPPHPGGVPALPDPITREAYSHELSSAGFWPGGGAVDYPAFYSYAYPEPAHFRTAPVQPAEAFFHPDMGEFLLPYEAVQTADDPDAVLLAFLQSTYEAAAGAGGWDREGLECPLGQPGVPRAVANDRR